MTRGRYAFYNIFGSVLGLRWEISSRWTEGDWSLLCSTTLTKSENFS